MNETIALITGATGFLGQKFLYSLQNHEKNKFCDIISVDRDHKCMSHVNSETFNLSELPKKNFHLFHFATLYNPKPKTYQEIELIINANINFPLEVIKSNSAITKAYYAKLSRIITNPPTKRIFHEQKSPNTISKILRI